MAKDPEHFAHQEWLGYVQPVGLVVSIPALLAAQAHVNRNIIPDHQRFLDCLPRDSDGELIAELRDFAEFTHHVLGWRTSDLESVVVGDPRYESLEVLLREYNETLRPTHVVREMQPKDPALPWMLLVQVLPTGTSLDEMGEAKDRTWHAPPQARFERLLRETRVPLGILSNETHIRIVYAPRGETSGFATFSVSEMAQVAGRPIFAALQMLLCEERLFSLAEKQRLPAILADSRKYQNVVSTQLAAQVLAALYELVRGFQAADDQRKGELLRQVLAENPNHVYQGLLTVLMRMVFVLYAEDRNLLSSDPVFANYYSLTGLFDRLRTDAGRHLDTMDQRYGAWAQLLTLFRVIYEGASHRDLRIPARQGYLFDPDRYNFLEGRAWRTTRRHDAQAVDVPRVSDGVIFRVLSNLLILDGERLSYRTLDVEQIGSVYETIMGFELEVAQGRSIAIKPKKTHGAPTTINLESLLAVKGTDRAKWLKEAADQDLSGQSLEGLKKASTLDELLAALDKKIARLVTPNVVSKGAMVLQPSDERRKSGSHYTPRSLTEPIVRTTLKPVLDQLGEQPLPDKILSLKICDPAMGSGAFLVEACRQLGDELVKAWHFHNCVPKLPPDEDEVLHARRLVAQRCLYGVDRNRMAVDLSKLSLWLATLAKDHPFTFLDHSLRFGDSLVGLTSEQISAFQWGEIGSRKGKSAGITVMAGLQTRIEQATASRRRILDGGDDMLQTMKEQLLLQADEALSAPRVAADACLAAFFSSEAAKAREQRRLELFDAVGEWSRHGFDVNRRGPITAALNELRQGPHPIEPFHWQIEFPEVFTFDSKGKPTGGFDAIVGNPPFAGKNTLFSGNREGYLDWLKILHEESHGNADLVAHFFRRAFNLLLPRGCFGLIATNTIGQGDTRSTGLRWICLNGGTIYAARRRYKWPGQAAVIVSIVHVSRAAILRQLTLDEQAVPIITAYLFHAGGHDNPSPLRANEGRSFQGMILLGMGFTFDDTDTKGIASSLAEMKRLIQKDARNSERIFPYIGGEEILDDPAHAHHRFAIDFFDMTLEEAGKWPDLLEVVRAKVKPDRDRQNRDSNRDRWWQYGEKRPALRAALRGLDRQLVIPFVAKYHVPTFVPATSIVAGPANVITVNTFSAFAAIQSSTHELWARTFSSSMEDRPRYTPSDCFETFPFPLGVIENTRPSSQAGDLTLLTLDSAGREYYEYRAALLMRNNEGLTKTYNRFHDSNHDSFEPNPEILADIQKLRELHAAMDRAVLEAYGWHDLAQSAACEFLLDYEDEEGGEEEAPGKRAKKKPWRYRWPDEFRDEVLARLLELNKQRGEEERLAGSATKKLAGKAGSGAKAKRPTKRSVAATKDMFDRDQEQFYIRMLLRAWNRPLTRHALDNGLNLMLCDDIRTGWLGKPKPKAKTAKSKGISDGLDYVLQEMELLGHIHIDKLGMQHKITILSKAPPTSDAPLADVERINDVKQIFEMQLSHGNVKVTQEFVDAEPDFVFSR